MITTEQPFIITLVRDRSAGRAVIVLIWPTRSTEIEPSQLAAVTTAIVATLAEARVQLGLIRAAER
jgi:hypothetical protein